MAKKPSHLPPSKRKALRENDNHEKEKKKKTRKTEKEKEGEIIKRLRR